MKKLAATVTVFLFIAALTKARAQLYEHPFNLHQLNMGQASIATGAEIVNERITAVGSLEYGVLSDIEAFLKVGQLYFEDEGSTTQSPISFFYSGISSIQPLIRSDWECLASASFLAVLRTKRQVSRIVHWDSPLDSDSSTKLSGIHR